MQEINDTINFAGSMLEILPQQTYAVALFVLWFGLGLVGIVLFRKSSARLQKQLSELRREVRQLQLAESRLLLTSLNSSSGDASRVQQEEALPSHQRPATARGNSSVSHEQSG